MRKVGAIENLLPKDHTHLFVNSGGDLRELDFRFPIGAPFNGLKAFFTTPQLTWVDKLPLLGITEPVQTSALKNPALVATTCLLGSVNAGKR